jgi:3-oxoacyl-[acyl-carrier-protein] synthase II
VNAALVTGIGWAGALGVGGGRPSGPFPLADGPLPALSRKDVFDEPNPRFGRMSDYSKLGVAAVAFALRDAGLDRFDAKRPIGVVADSALGCLSTDIEYHDTLLPAGGGLASPALFAYTLANCFLGEAAILFGLTGPGVVLTGDPGGDRLDAMRTAVEMLATGECGVVVAGCCDHPTVPAPPGIPGVPPGALFLVLESREARSGLRHGRLALAADGSLRLDGAAVADFGGLARTLLSPATPTTEGRP